MSSNEAKDAIERFLQNAKEYMSATDESELETLYPFFHFDHSRQVCCWITMGGPNIYVDVEYDPVNKYVKSAEYNYHWGNTHYTEKLSHDHVAFAMCEEMAYQVMGES